MNRRPDTNESSIEKLALAMNSIALRHGWALKDPARPKIHAASPAGILGDVWGGIYYRGLYHLFYDINADNTPGRYIGYVGHMISRDLLCWEQRPLALAPSDELGEFQLNDGCVALDGDGKPVMYYTSVFIDRNKPREHRAVRGDDSLTLWSRIPEAVISLSNHGGPAFRKGWSDPVIFSAAGRSFMLISKCVTPDGENRIPIYEAEDNSLLRWKYKGIFFNDTGEVINFFPMGEKWVLIYCPYDKPVYYTGSFDLSSLSFVPEIKETLCWGYISQGSIENVSRGLYATTVFDKEDGDKCLLGWISGFENTSGWEGAVSLPRILSLDVSRLIMRPDPVLDNLRGKRQVFSGNAEFFDVPAVFELNLTVKMRAPEYNIRISFGMTEIVLKNDEVRLRDISAPCAQLSDLRLYADVSVAELFANDGSVNLIRCISPLGEKNRVCIECSGVDIEGDIYNLIPERMCEPYAIK